MLQAACLWFGQLLEKPGTCCSQKAGISGSRVCPESSYAAEGPETVPPCRALRVACQGLHAACWEQKRQAAQVCARG